MMLKIRRECEARSASTLIVSLSKVMTELLLIFLDALIIILQAPAYMCYQLAFLSNEIDEIFANAPITRASVQNHSQQLDALYNGKRKPVDGECPICVFAMEPGDDLVWCKAGCGQNFHEDCFEQCKWWTHFTP